MTSSGEANGNYMDRNEINSRTNFPESWFWTDIPLTCPLNDRDW